MKKLACSLLTIIILFTISCEIGLGSSVDTDPPSLDIDPAIVSKVIADDFDIEGTYSDDGIISDIKAVLKRTDKTGKDIEIDGILEEDLKKRGSGIWKIPVKSKTDNITDGEYQATVYIKDSMGRITTQSTTFTIDNTPPVLILTKPNSKPTDETVSAYGQRIFLEGSIADTAKETYIKVDFYKDANCTGDPLISIKTDAIAPTDVNSNNARIAVFADPEDDLKLYEKIYQSSTKEGSKDVYLKITASDIAGNETTDFYFSKDLAKNITKTKNKAADAYGLAPIDIYNILNGTDALKTTDRAAEDSDIENIKALLRENTIHTAMISVNPENSPYFTVSGMKTLTKSGSDFESKENGYWVINGAQTLEISVFMGSDSIELVDDENFYVYVLECDNLGNPLKEDKEENRIKLYSKSKETGSGVNKKTYYSIGGKEGHKTTSGAYVFTVPMSKTIRPNPDETTQVTQNLDYKNYIIRVSGEDNEGNPIEPSEASGYGFHLSAGTGAPILNVEKPTDTTIFRKKGVGILFEGSAKSSEGLPTLTLWNDSNKDEEGNVVPVKIADIPLETGVEGELNRFSKEFTVEELGFPLTSKTYSLSIKASSGDQITEKSFSVWYDVEGPEITITSIQPVVNLNSKQNINGKLKINGTIIDKFDQFGSATFKAYQKKTANGDAEEVTAVTKEIESSFEHELDTTKLTDEKEVILEIKAYDRVGNETIWTKEYYVDQSTDKPVFTNSSSSLVITEEGASESILDDGKNMFMRGSSLVLGVTDDDGVKEAEIIMQKKNDDGSFEAVNKNDSTKTLYSKIENPSVITHTIPNTVGIYRTTVIAYDNNYISDEETPNNFEKAIFIIRVTGTGPDVSITTPEKDFISTISGDGSINLKFEVKGVGSTFQLYKNDDPLFPDAQGKATPKASPIIYNLQYSSEELLKIKNGEIEPEDITFKVTDTQGFTDKIYTPKFDSDWPEVRITKCPPLEPDSSTEEASYLFRGEMKDDTSGIEGVSIKFINGDATSAINAAIASSEGWLECTSGSTTWTYEATWTGTDLSAVFGTEGKKTVIVKATDGAGNITTASQTFTYDKMKPEVLEVSGNTTTQGEDVTLTIDLKDTNLVNPQVSIKQGTSTLQVTPVVTAPTVVDSDNNYYRSTATIPFNTEITTNGTYDVEVIAKDANGRSSAAPYKTVRIIRDNVAPEITFTSPSGASSAFIQKSSYKFEGTITDANEITEATATLYRVTGNGANDKEKVGETETLSPNKAEGGKWAWQVYELDPGTYKLEVYAKDIAGNDISLTSNTVNMDNTRPVLTVTQTGLTTSAGAAVTTPLASGNTYYAKGTYSIVCTVNDINFDYTYTPSLVTYTAKNSNAGDQACTISSSSTHAFTIAPNTFVNADGTYTYNISVKDKAGNTSDDFEIKVQLDTTGPTVEIRNPAADITEAKNALDGTSYSFRINANDGSGVGVTQLSYVFSKESDISQVPDNQWITVDFTDGDKNIDMPLVKFTEPSTDENGKISALSEGNWYLYAKAMDKSGNVTDLTNLPVANWKRAFPVDKEAPTLNVNSLSESNVNSLFAEISNGGYTISGTAEDTNELDATEAVTIDVDGSKTTIAKSAISNNQWSYKILTGTTNGTLKADEPVVVKVIAKDVAGRTTSKTFTLYYDTKDPELEVTAPDADEAVEENKKLIKGTVSDGGYGIKSLTYKLYKGTSGTEVVKDSTNKEVTSENYPVTIKGEQWFVSINEGKIPLGDDEGSLRLEVIATEDSNATPVEGRKYKTIKTIPFYYDKANPGLEETGIGTTGKTTNEQFVLTGRAWDSNELDRIEIKCGGKTWTSKTQAPSGQITGITLTKATAEPGDNNWSATFVVGTNNSSENNYIADGTQEFTITAYDISGKEYQRSRTVVVDTVNPNIKTAVVTTAKASAIEGLTGDWYKTRTLSVEVTPEDKKTTSESETENGSGVSKVEYATEAGENAVWTPLSSKDGKYTGSVSFGSDGKNKTIRIKATDVAGNESTESEITLNIDTSSPTLTANYYKLGDSGTPAEAKGIVYIQKGAKLIIYGNYKDTDSGVKDLTFTTEEPDTTTLTKTYSTTAITSTTLPNDYVAYNTANLDKDKIKSWKLEYIPTTTGIISVKGNNRADFETSEINIIDITIDEEAPAFSNEKFEEISGTGESQVTKSVYQKDLDSKYYTNNTGKTYVISGVATDDVGLADITLTVENTATTGKKDTIIKDKDDLAEGASLGKWKFEFTLPEWKTGARATVIVKDKAGRETPSVYDIVFDTEAPTPEHLIDAKGKDLVFRIGNSDNDGVEKSGNKYSGGSFGNDTTIMIRGNFTDNSASELKSVWYKIYKDEDSPLFINGKEYSTNLNETFTDLEQDVLSTGKSISPLAEKQTKKVYYSIRKADYDAEADDAAKAAIAYNGTLDGNASEYENKEFYRFYKNIDTIFIESISGFSEGKNYLVLVAEDNAGNTAIDKATVTVDTESRVFPCFSLNVDTNPPTIAPPESMAIKYTNPELGECKISASVTDDKAGTTEVAGVKDVKFTFEYGGTKEVPATYNEQSGKWEADIASKLPDSGTFTISAVATDAAGTGNSSTRTVATVMIDKKRPTVVLTPPKDADEDTTDRDVNGIIDISGTAEDDNQGGGLSPDDNKLVLYYTRSSTLGGKKGSNETSGTMISDEDIISETDATHTAEDYFVKISARSNAASWTFASINVENPDGTTVLNDSKEYYLMAASTDRAGNTGYSDPVKVKINKNSDRPIVRMSNIQKPTSETVNNETVYIPNGYLTSSTVNGSIKDDDGTILKLWVWQTKKNGGKAPSAAPTKADNGSITIPIPGTDESGWIEFGSENSGTSIEDGNWQIESSEGDGTTGWYWAIQDAKGKIFSSLEDSNELNRPYLHFKGETAKEDWTNKVIKLQYDLKSPEIKKVELVRFDTNLYKDASVNPKIRYPADEIVSYMQSQSPVIAWSTEDKMVFGRDKALMYVKVTVFEETGMSATIPVREENNYLAQFLDVTAGEVAVTHTGSTYEYILGPYDLSKVDSLTEEHTLNFIATDMANKTGSKEKPIRVDNTAEITLKGVSPKPTDVKTGEFTFSSEIEDSMSTISAMSYHIPPYSSWNGKTDAQKTSYMKGLTGEGDWTEIPDVSTSWRIDFLNFATEQLGYTINKTNNTSALNSKYEAYNIEINGEKQGIYNIPVCFKVTDEVGNIGYVRKGKYDKGVDAELKDIIIQFNPNSDRPTVTITDPELTTDGVVKSGSVTIKGTATDNEGIAAVYIQIEKNGDGTFAENTLIGDIKSIAATGDTYKGLLASGTKNWKYSLNISGLTTNDNLRIRAIAIDSDTEAPLVSAWSTPTLVRVNNTIPFFENLYVRQYASTDTNATGKPILEREHEGDIYITGENWYFEGEVSTPNSENTMTELDFTVDNETDEWTGNGETTTHNTTKIDNVSVSYGVQTDEESGEPKVDKTKFKFKVPVTGGTLSVEIRAKDNTENGGEQTETFTVNLDNTKPSFPDMYKINESDTENLGIQLYRDEYGKAAKLLGTGDQLLQNSNGSKFILAGKVTEAGSGFDKAVFYFKRKAKGNGSVDRVYNVMEAHGSNNKANRTNIADSSDATTAEKPIYINGDDLPVRALTLTKVSNGKFSKEEIQGNLNIRVGGLVKLGNLYRKITDINRTTGEVTITPEYSGTDFAAEFVYGMVVDHEGEREDSDGTVNNSSDDGDGIYETIDGNKNSGFNWTATFNSANLPDGPFEVHVVVFDKAGLTGHGYTQTKASNNAPRITKVMLGTDMNGNGKFDYGTGEFKTFYAVEDDDKNPIVKSGVANWELDTSKSYNDDREGNPVYWKVRSGIAAIPEFVGGTGPFYWQMSRAETKITNPGKIASNLVASRQLKASGANDKIVRKTTGGLVNATWSYSTYKVSGEDVENSGGSLAIAADDTLMTTGADALEDKVVYYSFTFWDSTEDCTPGDDTGYTILNAKVKQDITDTTAPVAVIKPFEWTGTGYTKRTIITENELEKSDVTDNEDTLENGEKPGTSETTVVVTDDQGKTTITTTKVIITPKNSLYNASKENGHIELEADVANNTVITGIAVGDDTLGADAKVSGKITFHGTAYDETRLSSLWFKFDGFSPDNGLTQTTTDEDVTLYDASTTAVSGYTQAAWYYKDTATWIPSSSTIANGWEVVVSDSKFDQTGHYVDWYLSIDTAKIASQVGIDKTLSVIFMDAQGRTSSTDASGSSDYTEKYNKPVYSMDVVPYISGITTEIHNKSGLKDSNIRSAKGYYSVIFGRESTTTNRTRDTLENDFIAVHGFNLNPAAVQIVKSSAYNASTVTYESGDPVTFTDTPVNTEFNGSNNTQATGYTTFWAKNDIANSGYLEVFVKDANNNYIRTLNNINNNDSHGSASYSGTSVTRYKNAYNREAEYEGTRNVTLTDDRYILMWDMQKTNTKNGYYPNMLMEGDNPVFGLVDLNGWTETTVASGYYNNMLVQQKKFKGTIGNEDDGEYYGGDYLMGGFLFDQMAMARDSSDKYIYASVYNNNQASMGFIYDKFASYYTDRSGWQSPGSYWTGQTLEKSSSGRNNALNIEGMNVGKSLIDRYQNLRLIADGNSTTTNGANIYMTYYDDYDSSILFREFKIKKKTDTDTMISKENITFSYYDGYGYLYNGSWDQTNYDGQWVKIGVAFYKLQRKVAGGRYYYYTITGYSGTSEFTSSIYPSNPSEEDVWSQMNDSDVVTNQIETTSYNYSAPGRSSVTSSGSRFYDFGIVKSNNTSKAVLVYYDFAAGKLKVKYSNQALNGSPSQNVTWTESALNLPESVGQYVSMIADGSALHIAAFDQNDSDLVYIYIPDYATTNPKGYTSMTVDAAGSVGNWTSIKIDKTADNKYYNKPIIAYYNSSETGGHDAIKLAIPNAQAGSVTAGIDSSNYTSTGWEYMTVPSVDAAQGGNNKFQRVCLDFDQDGDPVVGYLATNIEFGKQLPEAD